ncbi:uncharacterized protein DS421_4g128340 [Arachis hypogaea]|nr:uncharacterized protein DS421_4g128340 [Arachis hypogaea]
MLLSLLWVRHDGATSGSGLCRRTLPLFFLFSSSLLFSLFPFPPFLPLCSLRVWVC